MAVGLLIILIFGVFFLIFRKHLSFCMRTTKKGVNERISRGIWMLCWCFFAFIVLAIMARMGLIESDYPNAWLMLLGLAVVWLAVICYFIDFRTMRNMFSYKTMDYFRQTDNAFKDILGNVFIHGEYDLYSSLNTIKGYKRIVVNPKLPGNSGKLFEVDMICITEKAILVADALFRDGRWSGDMLDEIWGHETKTARFSMPNPILSNQEKIIALNNFLCDKNEGYYGTLNKDLFINFILCGLNSQLTIKGTVPNNCMVFSRQVESQFYSIFDKMDTVYSRQFIDGMADLLESRSSYSPEQRKKAIEKKYKPIKAGKSEKAFYATILEGNPLKTSILRFSNSGFSRYDGSLFIPTSAKELEALGYGKLVQALKNGGGDNTPVFDSFHNAFGQSAQIMGLIQKKDAPSDSGQLASYLESNLDYLPVYYTPEK